MSFVDDTGQVSGLEHVVDPGPYLLCFQWAGMANANRFCHCAEKSRLSFEDGAWMYRRPRSGFTPGFGDEGFSRPIYSLDENKDSFRFGMVKGIEDF